MRQGGHLEELRHEHALVSAGDICQDFVFASGVRRIEITGPTLRVGFGRRNDVLLAADAPLNLHTFGHFTGVARPDLNPQQHALLCAHHGLAEYRAGVADPVTGIDYVKRTGFRPFRMVTVLRLPGLNAVRTKVPSLRGAPAPPLHARDGGKHFLWLILMAQLNLTSSFTTACDQRSS
ncbi:hypothetical protein D3C85_706330 [compost metagenome]